MAEAPREPGTYIELDKEWDEPGWTRVPTAIARLKTISRGAKGLVLELSSHTPGRRLTLEDLVESSADGRDSTRARIAELERVGLLTRYQERDRYGRLGVAVYRLHVQPQAGSPQPSSADPSSENPTTVDSGWSEPLSENPTTASPTTASPTSENPVTSKKTRTTEDQEPSSSSEAASAAPDQKLRDDVEQLCTLLHDRMIDNGCKEPTVGKLWRNSTRLLLDRDKRPLDEALDLLAWCQDDEFWRGNIRSMPKFREQYDALRLKWQKTNPVRHLRSEEAIRHWLRQQWKQGLVKGIEDRSGLRYPQPDLPEGITNVDQARKFHADAVRAWITEHHERIVTLIQQREQPVAS